MIDIRDVPAVIDGVVALIVVSGLEVTDELVFLHALERIGPPLLPGDLAARPLVVIELLRCTGFLPWEN